MEVYFFQPLLYIKAGTALSDPEEVTVADDFGIGIVEAEDYDWLIEFKKSYRSNKLQPNENKKLGEGEFIALTVEENFVPEKLNDINFGNPINNRLFLKNVGCANC